ncbi:MAG: aldehyde ferredoxin oxidoreductase N-terminal domain-containing protein [Candidatus Thorarchaeota archaeon]
MTVDLSKKIFSTEDRTDLFQNYLGGAGVGIKLLEENCPKGADPLGSDNPIVFSIGPLTGLYPLASKTVSMFKSPLTRNLGESHAGGRSAIAIRSAGLGAIVIKGRSERPIYLSISDKGVRFKDASALWGIMNSITVGRIIREQEPMPGIRTIMRIGGAGEKLVKYACVTTETYRHFGRLGLGAVFGSKKLKAICIFGNHSIDVTDPFEYKRTYDEIYQKATSSPLMKKYHDYGTAANIMPLNLLKGLPTKNLTENSSEKAVKISGETLAENHLGRRVACAHCPVACIHIATVRVPYKEERFFYKTLMIPYDYELIYALGSMLGVFDVDGMLRMIEAVEIFGMDAMSTGVTLAWATEAQMRGLVTEEEALDLMFSWGDYEIYIKAIRNIVMQPNEFYSYLAMGVDAASERYGGSEFALAFGGNEMPGYHTGLVSHVSFLVGSRHSHLDAGGYSIDQSVLQGKELSMDAAIQELLKEESWRQILSSLVVCFFARGIYDIETVKKTLKVSGLDTSYDIDGLGLEILLMKNRFKAREGFDPMELRIPSRIYKTPSARGEINENEVKNAVHNYFKLLYSKDGKTG